MTVRKTLTGKSRTGPRQRRAGVLWGRGLRLGGMIEPEVTRGDPVARRPSRRLPRGLRGPAAARAEPGHPRRHCAPTRRSAGTPLSGNVGLSGILAAVMAGSHFFKHILKLQPCPLS